MRKKKVVNDAILAGGNLTNIYNKILHYYSNIYGNIDFKEVLLYSLSVEELQYTCRILELMPELTQPDSDSFINLLKLYANNENINFPIPEDEVVFFIQNLITNFTIVSLLKQNKIFIKDTNNGDWLLQLNEIEINKDVLDCIH